jgi:hypothetical protein
MSLFFGVLVASLLGSIHCAAMCGGFVCAYVGSAAREGGRAHARRTGVATHASYHAGRLVSYVALGLTAGALGGRVDTIGGLAGASRAAAMVSGALMVAWGASAMATALGYRMPWSSRRTARRSTSAATLGGLLLRVRERSAPVRAGALGLFTTLLPCGWLYVFVVTAGGTGRPMLGAAVMATFWAGTVPMLFAVGVGLSRVFGPLARRLPAVSAAIVLVAGLLTLAGKLQPLGTLHHTTVMTGMRHAGD